VGIQLAFWLGAQRRDAIDVAVRESTRLAREPRRFRDGVVPRRMSGFL
jgi:hypothetical protein